MTGRTPHRLAGPLSLLAVAALMSSPAGVVGLAASGHGQQGSGGAAAVPTAAATSAPFQLDGFTGGVRVAADLEPPGLRALARSEGSGTLAIWIRTGQVEVVEAQTRLRRMELREASSGEPRAVMFEVEIVRADGRPDRSRRGQRRYLVKYERLESRGDSGGRAKPDSWIEVINVSAPIHAKVVEGDLLARIGRGRSSGKGQIQLEGSEALVFFLGGVQDQTIREIRGRTKEGRTFVLKGVRIESVERSAGRARAHLIYQDVVIP
jgi:hypothetical protein